MIEAGQMTEGGRPFFDKKIKSYSITIKDMKIVIW